MAVARMRSPPVLPTAWIAPRCSAAEPAAPSARSFRPSAPPPAVCMGGALPVRPAPIGRDEISASVCMSGASTTAVCPGSRLPVASPHATRRPDLVIPPRSTAAPPSDGGLDPGYYRQPGRSSRRPGQPSWLRFPSAVCLGPSQLLALVIMRMGSKTRHRVGKSARVRRGRTNAKSSASPSLSEWPSIAVTFNRRGNPWLISAPSTA